MANPPTDHGTAKVPSLPALIGLARERENVLDKRLAFSAKLYPNPQILTTIVNYYLSSDDELVPDEMRRVIARRDKHISGAIFEVLHTAVQDSTIWGYMANLLELLKSELVDSEPVKERNSYRVIITQEISNVCQLEYTRSQRLLRRMLQTDMGAGWFKRQSNAYDKAGNARVVIKASSEDLKTLGSRNPKLLYLLRLTEPRTTPKQAIEWLEELSTPRASKNTKTKTKMKLSPQVDGALHHLGFVIMFIFHLKLYVKIPSHSFRDDQMFVPRYQELEQDVNAVKDQLDLSDFAVPVDKLLKPRMVGRALKRLDQFVQDKIGCRMGLSYDDLAARCFEDLKRQYRFPDIPVRRAKRTAEERVEQRKQLVTARETVCPTTMDKDVLRASSSAEQALN
ncbi:hypothetical protein B0T21DRAFT_142414 [Apiosordaria backusii]|uniref:Uncharacterized protein n=1 Tax=Apiosordaria backusii TaxID=314023 RepID=A0AA40BSE8_9PEZI|nr:hypothetical protein B0T21DRAFT_142414 [Apiosordaria backusii]